jgi:ATP-dependent Clp protease protease subunit
MPTNRKSIKALGSCRVVQLFGEIDEKLAQQVITNLIALDKKGNRDILLMIDTVGGDLDAAISIYQVACLLKSQVATLALSNVSSAGTILLACGAQGKRMVMEQSIVMLHDISSELSNDYHQVLENEILSLRCSKRAISEMLIANNAAPAIDLIKPAPTYLLGKEVLEYKIADVVIKNLEELHKVVKI